MEVVLVGLPKFILLARCTTLFSISKDALALSSATILRILVICSKLRAMTGCPGSRQIGFVSVKHCLIMTLQVAGKGFGPGLRVQLEDLTRCWNLPGKRCFKPQQGNREPVPAWVVLVPSVSLHPEARIIVRLGRLVHGYSVDSLLTLCGTSVIPSSVCP